MPKVKVDISNADADRASGAARPQPKPGWYNAKVVSIKQRKDKGDFEVVYEVMDKKFKGAKLYEYVNYEREDLQWKLARFAVAVGLVSVKGKGKKQVFNKTKVTIDTDDVIGTEVRVRVRAGSYNDEYKAEIAHVSPGGVDDEEVEETDEEEDLDDDEEEDDEEEDEDEDEDEDDDEEDLDDEDEEEDDDDDVIEDEDEEEEEEEDEPPAKKTKKGSSKSKSAPKGKNKKKGSSKGGSKARKSTPAKKGKGKKKKDLPF